MAKTEKISSTRWRQSLKGRKQFNTLSTNGDVAKFCELLDYKDDPRDRLLQISFENHPDLDIIDRFRITSGREISLPKELQNLLKQIISADDDPYIIVSVLDTKSDQQYPESFSTTGSANIKTRIGQLKFRLSLIDYWGKCAVTGLPMIKLLKASHIKPWSISNDKERIDKYNGLLLSPTLDALFDKGLITFSKEGGMIISEEAKIFSKKLGISNESKLYKIEADHDKYLKYHREKIFKKSKSERIGRKSCQTET